jgi:hypothetical protein
MTAMRIITNTTWVGQELMPARLIVFVKNYAGRILQSRSNLRPG